MQHTTTPSAPVRGAVQLVVLVCAARAGAHAGLVPEHLRSEPHLGAAFLVAVVLLLCGALALTVRPHERRLTLAVAGLLASLIAAFAASRTTGIPVLAPDPEGIEAVGVITNVLEALGLVCAVWLSQPFGRQLRRSTPQEVSRSTGLPSVAAGSRSPSQG